VFHVRRDLLSPQTPSAGPSCRHLDGHPWTGLLKKASSGKVTRHRLNRGGDRQANAALYRIVLVRLRFDQATKDYMQRRTAEGKSKKEVIRCLKRYVAREVYAVLTATPSHEAEAVDAVA